MSTGINPGKRTRLVERERELGRIERAIEDLKTGSPGLIVVEGPAGIGKTELLAAARSMAVTHGLTALPARATELEAAFSYGVVRQLLEPPLAAATERQRAELLQGAAAACRRLLWPGAQDAGTSSAADSSGIALLHSLWWLTVNLAGHNPILLTLDDAQWADQASLRFLLYLANRLEHLPLCMLLTVRSGEPLSAPLDELLTSGSAEWVRLEPLSAGGTSELVRDRLSEDSDDAFCRACHEATSGNPFLLRELLATVADKAIEPDAKAAALIPELGSPSVSRSVLRRLGRLGPRAADLAGALALWGGRAELRQAAAVAGIGEAEAGAVADSLAAIDIIRPGRPLDFVHPLVRTAIYSDLPAAIRSLGHRRIAGILERELAPAEQVAAHLLLTEPAGDPGVVQGLLKGAGGALVRGSPEEAKRYLERALREPPDRNHLGRVLRTLGVAEMRIDPEAAVGHLSAALEAAAVLEERAQVALDLIKAHLHAGAADEAERVIRPLIEALYPGSRELALRLEAELLIAMRQGLAVSPVANEQLDQWKGQIHGESAAERLILSQMAVRAALSGSGAEEVADLAEAALGDGLLLSEQSSESLAAYVPLYPLMCADRFDVVERYLDKALQDARDRGSPVAYATASVFRAILALATGDVHLAESESGSALELFSNFRLKFLTIGAVEPAISAHIELDRSGEADELLQRSGLGGSIVDTVPGRILLATRGRLRIVQGRTAAGLEDLLFLMNLEAEKGPSNLYLMPYRPWAALGLAQTGDSIRATKLMQEEVAAARSWGSPRVLAYTLILASRTMGGEEGPAMLREALEVTRDSRAKLVRAYALSELGAVLRRAGSRLDAIDLLRAGLDLAHRCGAEALAKRTREELVILGARPRRHALSGVDALTAGERRVAEMAASGMTNRQIAQDLFLTTRTVEHHLTHAYQKLGISSRKQLQKILGRSADG